MKLSNSTRKLAHDVTHGDVIRVGLKKYTVTERFLKKDYDLVIFYAQPAKDNHPSARIRIECDWNETVKLSRKK